VPDADPIRASFVFDIRPSVPPDQARGRRIPLDDWVTEFSPKVAGCGDVYRGLARLLRPDSATPACVLVCVDALSRSDMEFFALFSRYRRGIPVFAYSLNGATAKIATAKELGATGELTRSALMNLFSRESPPQATHDSPSKTEHSESTTVKSLEEGLRVAQAPRSPVPVETLPDENDWPYEAVNEDEFLPDETEEESPAPGVVRVPWKKDADRPVRIGPGAVSNPTGEKKSGPPAATSYEPLLSEEELRALMDDES